MPELEPLYTADEMRAAEARYPGYPETAPELMERAGAQTARAALELFAAAQRWTVVCGGGSNGGDGRIAARHLEAAGREVRVVDATSGETELGEPEVIVDALFGTGFSGEPRPGAAALIEQIRAPTCSRSISRQESMRPPARSRAQRSAPTRR
jgi:ADP-dependent NAD(P)H-hydrate dehydratase / NAD(P)H-hydrate epimerase